jgi:hypothetical protein
MLIGATLDLPHGGVNLELASTERPDLAALLLRREHLARARVRHRAPPCSPSCCAAHPAGAA